MSEPVLLEVGKRYKFFMDINISGNCIGKVNNKSSIYDVIPRFNMQFRVPTKMSSLIYNGTIDGIEMIGNCLYLDIIDIDFCV